MNRFLAAALAVWGFRTFLKLWCRQHITCHKARVVGLRWCEKAGDASWNIIPENIISAAKQKPFLPADCPAIDQTVALRVMVSGYGGVGWGWPWCLELFPNRSDSMVLFYSTTPRQPSPAEEDSRGVYWRLHVGEIRMLLLGWSLSLKDTTQCLVLVRVFFLFPFI